MSRNVYALIVGINNYKSSAIPSLKGCVNDVIAIEEFLKTRFQDSNENLHIRKLINEQATRQAIIDGFREHLCQATNSDIALFYFSGHGSQEEAAKIFWHIEPDYLNETLVCWDSRTDDIWDLADKELSYLIGESQKHPHFLVILDCCHSGGASRSNQEYTGIRSVSTNFHSRPLSSFIFVDKQDGDEEIFKKFASQTREYILLAACRDNEEAREHYSQKRGVFSYFLLDSLQRHYNLTYREALKRTNVMVRSFYPNQSPQIEATNSYFLDQPFLADPTITNYLRPSYFTVTYDGANGWTIDAGAVHGIATQKRTKLAIFPIEIKNILDSKSKQDAVAVAEVVEILPQLSKINISGERYQLDPQLIYQAVIISSHVLNLHVYLEGEDTGVHLARDCIQQACFGETSLYINEVYSRSDADYYLQAKSGHYLIVRAIDNQELVSPITEYTINSASSAIRALEHIARWMNIASLSNPDNSEIRDDISIQLYQEAELQDDQINLEYQFHQNSLQPPHIQIKLTNTGDTALYCALLNLTELFAINVIPFGTSAGIWLQPGSHVWVHEGNSIPITIPQHLLQQGVTIYKDILKLLVSTSEFDVRLLEQPSIYQTQQRSAVYHLPAWYDIHQLLFRAISHQPEPETPEASNSWATQEILISTTVPQFQRIAEFSEEMQTENHLSSLTGKIKNIGFIVIFSLVSILLIVGFLVWRKTRDDKLYIPRQYIQLRT
ncbi:MAG: caspase family protein [Calothrix sp. C42_A2020_038]|nr:caspase family protein [Calothrix sp. C42_A2020_038]